MSVNRQQDEAFLREWTIPEEDRAKYTSQPWTGEYRWFRSPNVVCLEHYRPRKEKLILQPGSSLERADAE
jgi:hypothetical protein